MAEEEDVFVVISEGEVDAEEGEEEEEEQDDWVRLEVADTQIPTRAAQAEGANKDALLIQPMDLTLPPLFELAQAPPRLPIVLCHGLCGFRKMGKIAYFRGIKKCLQDMGCKVLVTQVSPIDRIEVRAKKLYEQITAYCKENGFSQVNMIGHSMGGLDSRYLITHLDAPARRQPQQQQALNIGRCSSDDQVGAVTQSPSIAASLTTMSTPHRGSAYADWVLKKFAGSNNRRNLFKRLRLEHLVDTCCDLTIKYLTEVFNPTTPDIPGVQYLSVGGNRWTPAYAMPHAILLREEGANDGIVSIESAKWGEYLGTLRAGHLEQVGWSIDFDPTPVYRKIAYILAQRGL